MNSAQRSLCAHGYPRVLRGGFNTLWSPPVDHSAVGYSRVCVCVCVRWSAVQRRWERTPFIQLLVSAHGNTRLLHHSAANKPEWGTRWRQDGWTDHQKKGSTQGGVEISIKWWLTCLKSCSHKGVFQTDAGMPEPASAQSSWCVTCDASEGEDAVCRGIKQTCPPMFHVFSLKSWSIWSLNGCIAFFLLIHDWML